MAEESKGRTEAEQRSHAQTWNPFRDVSGNQAQVVALVTLLVVVSLIIGGLYLAQATTNISTVRDIEQIRLERNRLERDNERIKAEIARLQSIDNYMTQAATLGFHQAGPDEMEWLVVDGYVYNQATLLPTRPAITPTPANYEENFAGWLKRQLDLLREQFSEWAG